MENIENKHSDKDIEGLFNEMIIQNVDHQQMQIHECYGDISHQKIEKFKGEIGSMLSLIQSNARFDSSAILNESQAIAQKHEGLLPEAKQTFDYIGSTGLTVYSAPCQLEQSDDFHGFDFKDLDNEVMNRIDFVASIYGLISNKMTNIVSGIQRSSMVEENLNQSVNIYYGSNSKIPPRLRHKGCFAAMTPKDLNQSINIHRGYNSKIPPRLRHKRRFAVMISPESNISTDVDDDDSSETVVKRKLLQLY